MRNKNQYAFPAIVILLLFFFQCVESMKKKSLTYDEIAHPSAGITEMLTGSHRLINDHPPLFRYFLAEPLFFFKPNVPFYSEQWLTKKPINRRYFFGNKFYFGSGNDADKLIFASRLVVVFFAVLLGIGVFYFSSNIYGFAVSGLFSLLIFSFDPNIIAHSRIAKNDLFLSFFVFFTIYQLYNYIRNRTFYNLFLIALFFGFSISVKYSAFALLPFILFVFIFYDCENAFLKKIVLSLCKTIFVFLIGFFVLFVSYNLFYFSTEKFLKLFPEQKDIVKKYSLTESVRNILKGIKGGVEHLDKGHRNYFMGKISKKNNVLYFPVAFLVKNPVALIIFIFISFYFVIKERVRGGIFISLFIIYFFFILVFFSLNLGYRYMLPIQPFFAVLCGVVPIVFEKLRFSAMKAFLYVLVLWFVFEAVKIYPNYLSYFNEFVGPDNGYKYFVDSNLDWGQDLKQLKVFMDKNKIDWVYLVYFGQDDPSYRKIKYSPDGKMDYADGNSINEAFNIAVNAYANKKPGYFAISATHLVGVYLTNPHFFDFLKDKKPTAKIGYSIFIYNLK